MESRALKYPDFVEQHTWVKKSRSWKPRGRNGETPVGRVYTVHPSAGEVFYLRTLLHHLTGADLALANAVDPEAAVADRFGFDALKYVDGVKHETYQAACEARGLLQDNKEWFAVLDDARAVECRASKIRELYVYILLYNAPQNPTKLFDEFWKAMADDFKRELQRQQRRQYFEPPEATLRAVTLLELDERLSGHGKSLAHFHVAFTAEERELAREAMKTVVQSSEAKEIRDELPEDRDALAKDARERRATLLKDQGALVDAAIAAIEKKEAFYAFVDAPGGTGKTYCFNTLLSHVRAQGKIALAVASSGIAAILLALGRTFHSRFKASLKPQEGAPLNVSAQTALAELIRRADLIVWDEAPMMHRFQLEALDLTLRDLMKTVDPKLERVPFGGKALILAGDFRQTLPVLKKGSRAQVLDASIKRSVLWKHFTTFRLTENMRI